MRQIAMKRRIPGEQPPKRTATRFFPCISIILFFKHDGVFREWIPDAATVSVELSRKEKLSGLSFHTSLAQRPLLQRCRLFPDGRRGFRCSTRMSAPGRTSQIQARANLRLTERKSKLVCIGCIIAHLQIEPSFVNGRVDAEQRITGRLGKVFFVMAMPLQDGQGA